jgi:hypothetical protein
MTTPHTNPEDQFPWYYRILGWILEKIFGKSER